MATLASRSQRVSEDLVFSAWGLSILYQRFRAMQLQHYLDVNVTDPYTDPEPLASHGSSNHR